MPTKHLTTAEMLGVSASWLDRDRHRPAFEGNVLLGALVPVVQAAHEALVATVASPADAKSSDEVAALRAEGVETDRTHDRLGAGCLTILEGMERCAATPEAAAEVAAVRARLFPDGASVFNTTWLAEAGNAEHVERALADGAFARSLDAVTLWNGRTLLALVRAWSAAGVALGRIEARKVAAQTRAAQDPAAASPRSANGAARAAWIQAVAAVRTNAALMRGDGADALRPMFHALDAAEALADARVARRREAAVEAEAPADNDDQPGDKPLAAVV